MKVYQLSTEKAKIMAMYFLFWSLIQQDYFWDCSCSAELVFTSRPADSPAILNSSLTLPCTAYDSRHHRDLTIRWLRGSGDPIDDLGVWVHQLANGSLFFPSLREADLGTYTCQASSGSSLVNATIHISKAYLDSVFYSPASQTVRAGQSVFFNCVSGDSLPLAQISWEKDGQLFREGTQIQGQYGGGDHKKISGTLHIPSASKEDEGNYTCVTHNPLLATRMQSVAASLTVQALPSPLVISQGPANITVVTETEAVLHCSVQGVPFPTVQWFKNSQPLLEEEGHLSLENTGQLLVFKNVSLEDEGYYYCEARNGVDTVTSQTAYLLPAVMDWRFGQQPANVSARQGDSATLICRPPRSNPPATVTWFKNNRILNKMPHFVLLDTGDLLFKRVKETDRGIYFCRASNSYLFRAISSVKAYLNVLVPPNVTVSPAMTMVPLGSAVSFHCQASGNPSPSIVWYKQGQTVKTGGKITVGFNNVTLYISSLRAYDEGSYTCEATNIIGQSRMTAILQIAAPPVIISFENEINCSEGATVVFLCEAVGDRPIRYSWYRKGNETQISLPKMVIDEHGSLHISNVSRNDEGVYHCTAENRAGRDRKTTALIVTAGDNRSSAEKRNIGRGSPVTNSGSETRRYDALYNEHRGDQPQERNGANSTAKARGLGPVRDMHGTAVGDHLVLSWQPPIWEEGHPDGYKISYSTVLTSPAPAVSTSVTEMEQRGMLEPESKEYGEDLSKPLEQSASVSTFFSITKQNGVLTTAETNVSIQGLLLDQTYLITVVPYTAKGEEGIPLQRNVKTASVPKGSVTVAEPSQPVLKTQRVSLTRSPLEKSQPSASSAPGSRLTSSGPILHLKVPDMANNTIITSAFMASQSESLTSAAAGSSDIIRPTDIAESEEVEAGTSLTSQSDMEPTGLYLTLTAEGTTNPSESSGTHQTQAANSSKSANSELTEWPKKNTSQSPMKTSDDTVRDKKQSSWLPVLEKHDIPIVVGVGISLALIFITMGFYSLIQKNEPTEAGRGLLRGSGTSSRNSSKPETGATYENRAFEDDNSVGIIDQSSHSSPQASSQTAPSTVTVTAELSPEGQQEVLETILENVTESDHSALLGSALEQEAEPPPQSKRSPPTLHSDIKLQNIDGWGSSPSPSRQAGGGGSGSKFGQGQDAEPAPRLAGRDDVVHTSLTLQTTEPGPGSTTPTRHGVGPGPGPAPVVLSHCVSLSDRGGPGITTVAVDVHFYPAMPSPASVPAHGSPSVHPQAPFPEYEQQSPTANYVQRTCL
nr:PREDICTED: uncharacterized protein LOC107079839 [Lepisosteus oculatus]